VTLTFNRFAINSDFYASSTGDVLRQQSGARLPFRPPSASQSPMQSNEDVRKMTSGD